MAFLCFFSGLYVFLPLVLKKGDLSRGCFQSTHSAEGAPARAIQYWKDFNGLGDSDFAGGIF